MEIHTIDELKDKYIGKVGTEERDKLERELEVLRIGCQIRNTRNRLNMTQQELADRINKKRTFISKVENDGMNLTLQTLVEIVEKGLGGKLKITVELPEEESMKVSEPSPEYRY